MSPRVELFPIGGRRGVSEDLGDVPFDSEIQTELGRIVLTRKGRYEVEVGGLNGRESRVVNLNKRTGAGSTMVNFGQVLRVTLGEGE